LRSSDCRRCLFSVLGACGRERGGNVEGIEVLKTSNRREVEISSLTTAAEEEEDEEDEEEDGELGDRESERDLRWAEYH